MQRRKRSQNYAHIRVVGVGSGGRTAVNNLISAGMTGVDFITIDTDLQSRLESRAPLHIRIGETDAMSQGTGGNADHGMRAAAQALDSIGRAVQGSDLVFIIAGLGGGTGSGVAPFVARLAKEAGAVVMGIVTYPFPFEGNQRSTTADRAVAGLRNWTDTLIVVPNDRLLHMADGAIGFHETYRLAHEIWYQSIQGIAELLSHSGLVNVDFADVRAIVSEGGAAVIANGRAKGKERARLAAERATHSELLGVTIDGAHGVLFNVTGGTDLGLLEVEEVADVITKRVHPNANVIFGATVDPVMDDELSVTVIATGFRYAEHPITPTQNTQPKPAADSMERTWSMELPPFTRLN